MSKLGSKVVVTWLVATIVAVPGCAPNRNQWMAQSASQQATIATSDIGTIQQVRTQAGQGAQLLNALAAAAMKNPPKGNLQAAQTFANDAEEVSAGLQSIKESQTDVGFTNAVLAMCDPQVQAASPRVGRVLMAIGGGIRNNPPSNMSSAQQQGAIQYFETFGGRLIQIPVKCTQAGSAMAQADAQERQAETEHQTNVNRALIAAGVLFTGTVVVASTVGAAAATRPPVIQNTYNNN